MINDIIAYIKDNVPVDLSGTLFFKVFDSNEACFNVSDYIGSVQNIGTSTIHSTVGRFDYGMLISERNAINDELQLIIGNTISNWGVECTRFEIQSFKPQNKEVEKQLEL